MRRAISPSRDPTLGPPARARNGVRNPVGLRFPAPLFMSTLSRRESNRRRCPPYACKSMCRSDRRTTVNAPPARMRHRWSTVAAACPGDALAELTDHARGERHPARVVHGATVRVNLVRPGPGGRSCSSGRGRSGPPACSSPLVLELVGVVRVMTRGPNATRVTSASATSANSRRLTPHCAPEPLP